MRREMWNMRHKIGSACPVSGFVSYTLYQILPFTKMKIFPLFTLLLALLAFTSCQKNTMFNTNKVVAHRGAWKVSGNPQNSIAALKEAVRLGCEGSEFDVWMTGDGVLVANHDPDHMGVPVETSTYQELLEKKLPNGEGIPTVEEYLK